MKKKNLIIFFPSKKSITHSFEHLRKNAIERELEMLDEIPQEKVNIYVVRKFENFFWANEFLPQFQMQWREWMEYTSKKHVFWDLVYGFRIPEGATHLYPSNIRDITIDKNIIEKLFPRLTLPSITCQSYEEIQNNFHKIKTDIKVLKPYNQSLWRGIYIWKKIPSKEELPSDYYPYLLQTFHDTSWWFYWLCKWLHDFRIIILSGKIIAKILRLPPKGTYISNVHTWGEFIDISDFSLPQEIQNIVETIENYCQKFEHRYYSIDMWVWKNGELKVFELNWAPGFWSEFAAREFWKYTAKHILKVW